MQISDGPLAFRFHDHWARIPDTPAGRINGRTHGVVALPDGRVAVFHQASPALAIYGTDGSLASTACDLLTGAHGLTLARGDEPALWLTDQSACVVRKVDLEGNELRRLDAPPADARPEGKYVPTWADEAPDGSVLVADGYGGSAVHRFDANGSYRDSLTSVGEAGDAGEAGRLACPHGLRFDGGGNLWIADRGNQRVLKLDGDWNLLAESTTACHSPCGFAFHGGHAYVPELFGGLKVLDADLNVVASLGQHPQVESAAGRERLGWPNVEAAEVKPGFFNSPHGCDVDAEGNVYVVEWILGGRIVKLERV